MDVRLRPATAALFAVVLLAAACGDDATEAGAEQASPDAMAYMASGGHDHGAAIEVPEGMAVPRISVTAEPDTVSGHNLFIDVEDFTIAPESASTEAVDGEGHLHLYVDGERILRFYNTALQLDGLEPGEHEIMVEVSANNHAAYAVDGKPVTAMTTVTVDDAGGGHGHGGETKLFESADAPAIELSITEDPKSGWNLFADVTGLTFAPEKVGTEAVDGEGHLHLLVDGEKVTRLYGPWWHIKSLDAGMHEISVEVSANDHSTYASNGEPVVVTAMLEVSEAMAAAAMGDPHDDHGEHGGMGEALDMTAADADVVIDASLADGDLTVENRRVEVALGSTVGITFESDVEERVHVHGYDLFGSVGPDAPVDLAFVADSPGTFEVELEDSGRFLFEIQVR